MTTSPSPPCPPGSSLPTAAVAGTSPPPGSDPTDALPDLLDALPVGVLHIAADQVRVNRALTHLTGLTDAAFTPPERGFAMLFGDAAATARATLAAALASGEPVRLTWQQADGGTCVLDWRGRQLDGGAELWLVQDAAADAAVRERLELTQRAVDHAGDAMLLIDEQGRLLDVNPEACRRLGYAREALLERSMPDIAPLLDSAAFRAAWERHSAGTAHHLETVHRSRDGRLHPVEVTASHFEHRGRKLSLAIARDLGERHAAEAQVRLYAQVFEHSSEAIVITDAQRRIVAVNAAFVAITGFAAAEALDCNARLLTAPREWPALLARLDAALAAGTGWQGEATGRRKDASEYPAWLSVSAVRDTVGSVAQYIAIFSDSSERKASEERIHFLAHYDALTGLPNRVLLHERIAHATAAARRAGWKVAVLFLDLDRFKNVNDSLGHGAGDQLLGQVAQRLRHSVREEDTVARLGGDEFVIVIERTYRDMDVALIADKILRVLQPPFSLAGRELCISTSVGISLYPDNSGDAEALIRNADTAMYHAKHAGRANFQFFSEEMNARVLERLRLESGLRRALEWGEFELYYQPQIALADNRIIGVEALLRWHDPELGIILPARFIPVAEDCGQIVAIGEWALREACQQARAWSEVGLAPVPIALNLSAAQFRQAEIATVLHDVLWEAGLAPARIAFEVTESTLMSDAEDAAATLAQLREIGVQLAIDDFGTGYSSLAYLKRFPIDALKIDRSFVRDLVTDPNDAAIAGAVIQLARSLGLRVIAEGVESAEQLAFLRAQGCEEAQGFYFSRPLPAECVAELLRAGCIEPGARH